MNYDDPGEFIGQLRGVDQPDGFGSVLEQWNGTSWEEIPTVQIPSDDANLVDAGG